MKKHYYIITPCFNEENLIEIFLNEIEEKLKETNNQYTIVVVDDASIDGSRELLKKFQFTSENFKLKVIRLIHNMGHQEAIRMGLHYVHQQEVLYENVIVMDSDGEDDPAAIKELVLLENSDIAYVSRGRRYDSLTFKLGYFFYKIFFKLVIGKYISYGNFSMISPAVLKSINNQRFLHFAAFLSKQKFKITKIQFDRQKRIDGESKMNLKSLVFHGLMSFMEYAEEILYFLIKFFFFLLLALMFLGGYILYSKYIADVAVLGWASSLGSSLLIASLIIINTVILGLIMISIKKSIFQNFRPSHYYEEI